MGTAWLTKQVTVSTIALWRSSMQGIGFIGAALAPILIQRLGARTSARGGQLWQACLVALAAFAFYTNRTTAFMAVIAASRLGLWCFDLAEWQLVQEAVPGP